MIACMEPLWLLRGAVQSILGLRNCSKSLHKPLVSRDQGEGGGSAIQTFVKSFQNIIFLEVSVNVRKPTLHKCYIMNYWDFRITLGGGGGASVGTKSQLFPSGAASLSLASLLLNFCYQRHSKLSSNYDRISHFLLEQWEIEIHLLQWASWPMTASNTLRSF